MLLTGQPLHAFDLDRVAGGELDRAPARARASRSTTLDDAERDARPRRCSSSPTPTARRRSPASWAARARRSPTTTTRVLLEVATWNGPTIHAHVARARPAHRGQRAASRRASRPSSRSRRRRSPTAADRRAERRAARRRARSTSAAPDRTPAVAPAARRARRARCSASTIPRERAAEHPRARSASAWPSAGDGLDVTVPHWRRDDVTREADLIEEVARLARRRRELPATLPPRRGAVGGSRTRSALRRRAEDVLVGARPARDRRLELRRRAALLDRLRLPSDEPAARRRRGREPDERGRSRSCARRCSASLLDAARAQHARAATATSRCSSPATVYRARRRRREPRRRAPRARARCSPARAGAADRGGDPAARHGRLLRRQGARRRGARHAARRLVASRRGRWPFLHPGRSAEVARGRRARSASSASCTRSSPRDWDLERPVAAFALDLGTVVDARARAGRATRTSTSFPPVRQDLAVIVAGDVAAGRAAAVVRAARAARCSTACEVFDVYRGAQVGEGRRSLALRLEFRRRRPHADRRGRRARARRDRRGAARRAGGELRG